VAEAAAALVPGKFKVSVSKQATLKRDAQLGRYMKLRELKCQVQAELEVTWRASSNQATTFNATERQVGQEFENSLATLVSRPGMGSIEVKEKHGWSGSPDGREVGIGVECDFFDGGSVEFRFNAIERSADNGVGVGVFHTIAQVNVARFLAAYRDRLTGAIQQRLRAQPFPGPTTEVKLKVTGGFDISIEPTWHEILAQARQLYPRIAQAAVNAGRTAAQAVTSLLSAEVLITAGFISGGVVAIAAPLAQLDENDRATELAGRTGRGAVQMCQAYEAVLRGGSAVGSSSWAAQGEQLARTALQRHAQGVDQASLHTELANQPEGSLARRMWNANWPRIKDETVRQWEANRGWVASTFGGTASTNHLRRVLSTFDDPRL
jgi:hypothetical protein